jgi:ubiquinol oxidase
VAQIAHKHPALIEAQLETLAGDRRHYGVLARLLFFTMDLVYARKRTFSKFKVLEVVARVPYQAWEQVAYVALTHKHGAPDFARRIFEFVQEARHQQDNEQWHLLILEELVQKQGIREGFLRYRVFPQLLAFFYYHTSWLLYVMRPRLSYRLNADFEDHAEHEYMEFVREHPELEDESWESVFTADYGSYQSVADMLRQIGLDERQHKEESVARMQRPRFG